MKNFSDNFDFFLYSLSKEQIKKVINFYNDKEKGILSKNPKLKPLKGIINKKKGDLVETLKKEIPKEFQLEIYNHFESKFVEDILKKALSLISGESKAEKIISTGAVPNGKGFEIRFKGKSWDVNSTVAFKANKLEYKCSCAIGRNGGFCAHLAAILVMMFARNMIKQDDFPFKLSKENEELIKKRINLISKRTFFKEEPLIVLEEDYNVYIDNDLVTLEWGGDFPGKTTEDLKDKNIDDWLSERIVRVMLRKIKVKSKEGYPIKILVDNYGIIEKIMERPKLVKKILNKFSALDYLNLPKTSEELEQYLRKPLKPSYFELMSEPPFKAYQGDEPYIFVSYIHKNKSEVFPVINRLKQEGFKIWYDEGIPFSKDWAKEIDNRLLNAKVILVFLSYRIIESEHTLHEIELALNNNKTIVPVFLDNVNLLSRQRTKNLKHIEIFDKLKKIQGIIMEGISEEKFYAKLIDELKNLLNT
ncbi:MAG: toll/interleukin-1 receptor domain-containing protein [Promethearchaeota archaeon]